MPSLDDKNNVMLQQNNNKGYRVRVSHGDEESFFRLIESQMKKQGYQLVETLIKEQGKPRNNLQAAPE